MQVFCKRRMFFSVLKNAGMCMEKRARETQIMAVMQKLLSVLSARICLQQYMILWNTKKKHHPSKIPCFKFQKGTCEKSTEKCRYMHSTTITSKTSTAPAPSVSNQALPSMWKQDFLPSTLTAAPDQGALVMALNMLNQWLGAMEERMFPKLK